MKTLKEMQLEMEQIDQELRDMKAHCESEDREPNDEEREKATEMLDRADELDGLIKTEQRILALNDKFKEPDPVSKEKIDATKEPPADQRKMKRRMGKPVFSSFGEQLQCIMRAGMGDRPDPRLFEVRAATGLAEAVGADGGFLLQEDFSAELLRVAMETGKLPGRCRQMTISGRSNSMKIPGVD